MVKLSQQLGSSRLSRTQRKLQRPKVQRTESQITSEQPTFKTGDVVSIEENKREFLAGTISFHETKGVFQVIAKDPTGELTDANLRERRLDEKKRNQIMKGFFEQPIEKRVATVVITKQQAQIISTKTGQNVLHLERHELQRRVPQPRTVTPIAKAPVGAVRVSAERAKELGIIVPKGGTAVITRAGQVTIRDQQGLLVTRQTATKKSSEVLFQQESKRITGDVAALKTLRETEQKAKQVEPKVEQPTKIQELGFFGKLSESITSKIPGYTDAKSEFIDPEVERAEAISEVRARQLAAREFRKRKPEIETAKEEEIQRLEVIAGSLGVLVGSGKITTEEAQKRLDTQTEISQEKLEETGLKVAGESVEAVKTSLDFAKLQDQETARLNKRLQEKSISGAGFGLEEFVLQKSFLKVFPQTFAKLSKESTDLKGIDFLAKEGTQSQKLLAKTIQTGMKPAKVGLLLGEGITRRPVTSAAIFVAGATIGAAASIVGPPLLAASIGGSKVATAAIVSGKVAGIGLTTLFVGSTGLRIATASTREEQIKRAGEGVAFISAGFAGGFVGVKGARAAKTQIDIMRGAKITTRVTELTPKQVTRLSTQSTKRLEKIGLGETQTKRFLLFKEVGGFPPKGKLTIEKILPGSRIPGVGKIERGMFVTTTVGKTRGFIDIPSAGIRQTISTTPKFTTVKISSLKTGKIISTSTHLTLESAFKLKATDFIKSIKNLVPKTTPGERIRQQDLFKVIQLGKTTNLKGKSIIEQLVLTRSAKQLAIIRAEPTTISTKLGQFNIKDTSFSLKSFKAKPGEFVKLSKVGESVRLQAAIGKEIKFAGVGKQPKDITKSTQILLGQTRIPSKITKVLEQNNLLKIIQIKPGELGGKVTTTFEGTGIRTIKFESNLVKSITQLLNAKQGQLSLTRTQQIQIPKTIIDIPKPTLSMKEPSLVSTQALTQVQLPSIKPVLIALTRNKLEQLATPKVGLETAINQILKSKVITKSKVATIQQIKTDILQKQINELIQTPTITQITKQIVTPVLTPVLAPPIAPPIAPPFTPPIILPPFTPGISIPGLLPSLKGKKKARRRRKLLEEEMFGLIPDLTSRIIGLEPIKFKSVEQALKEMKKLKTGLEIRRGGVIA